MRNIPWGRVHNRVCLTCDGSHLKNVRKGRRGPWLKGGDDPPKQRQRGLFLLEAVGDRERPDPKQSIGSSRGNPCVGHPDTSNSTKGVPPMGPLFSGLCSLNGPQHQPGHLYYLLSNCDFSHMTLSPLPLIPQPHMT